MISIRLIKKSLQVCLYRLKHLLAELYGKRRLFSSNGRAWPTPYLQYQRWPAGRRPQECFRYSFWVHISHDQRQTRRFLWSRDCPAACPRAEGGSVTSTGSLPLKTPTVDLGSIEAKTHIGHTHLYLIWTLSWIHFWWSPRSASKFTHYILIIN